MGICIGFEAVLFYLERDDSSRHSDSLLHLRPRESVLHAKPVLSAGGLEDAVQGLFSFAAQLQCALGPDANALSGPLGLAYSVHVERTRA
jgi:hypothetical protein